MERLWCVEKKGPGFRMRLPTVFSRDKQCLGSKPSTSGCQLESCEGSSDHPGFFMAFWRESSKISRAMPPSTYIHHPPGHPSITTCPGSLRPAAKRMIRLADPKLRPAQILTQDSQQVFGGRNGSDKKGLGERFDPRSWWDSSPIFVVFYSGGWWSTAHFIHFLLLEVPSSVFLLLSGACVFFLCFCLCVGSQFLLVCFLALWFWRVYMYMQTWVTPRMYAYKYTWYMPIYIKCIMLYIYIYMYRYVLYSSCVYRLKRMKCCKFSCQCRVFPQERGAQ